LAVTRVELDRMAAHPSGSREPAVTRSVLEDRVIHLPALATVVRPEEDARVGAEIERLWLFGPARLDVPRRVQHLRRGRSVDDVVRRREHRPVARVEGRVEHAPAFKQRAFGLPPAALFIAAEQKEPFSGANECEDADLGPYLDRE
jgi:hypothetical protein